MPDYPEIHVIRHGQTSWNLAGRHQGRLDSALTEKGQAQARAVGRCLAAEVADFTGVSLHVSPQGRAQATARLAFAGLNLPAKSDARLSEIAFGDWQGLTFDEIAAGWPERAAMAEHDRFLWHFQAPGGETLAELTSRARAFLDDLNGPAIIITHGVTSRILRGLWLGLDEDDMAALPGGQGVIFHLSQGQGHRRIEAPL